MDDKAHLFDLNDQTPFIQLFTFVLIVIIAGTLIFYLFVFAGSLIFGVDMSVMLSIPSSETGPKGESILKYIQASQQIAMFIIPAIVTALLLRKGKESFMKINKIPASASVLMVILLALFILPVTSFTGMLNSKMNLPVWLSRVEEWMRTKENTASGLTGLLMKSSGIEGLMINILILAIIPAVAEEMIFRGILQQILCKIFRSGHIGIWITAILFSAVHLQFFGFLPRLLLGLSFGYLFFWSGNLWLPVIAHFLNNAIPVVMSYFLGWNELGTKVSEFTGEQILLPSVSAIIIIMIFYHFWAEYKRNMLRTTR
jgi:membrane protease YdiL (CAAX protease family)